MNEIITIGAVIAAILILTDDIILRIRRRTLLKLYVESVLEKSILQDELANKSLGPSETEGFIKFLSESRQWAFDYIEDVQKVISELDISLTEANEEKIIEAYEKLRIFLPQEENNN
jgi:hypothetical protein